MQQDNVFPYPFPVFRAGYTNKIILKILDSVYVTSQNYI